MPDDWSLPAALTGSSLFASNTIRSFASDVMTGQIAVLSFCCQFSEHADYGWRLLTELIGQAVTHLFFDFGLLVIPRRFGLGYHHDFEYNYDFEQVMSLTRRALRILLDRTPIVIVIDAVQCYLGPEEKHEHTREALSMLLNFAEDERSRHPMKVLVTNAKRFEHLDRAARITTSYRLPPDRVIRAWNAAERE
ncbi:uncharacterized protein LTR77_007297 [Saxophila tyrrhenica]|uniref:AAA family ATPase n=1 Tax=Saxophila tyrrhenica TaxID=1690608 RepID=A0AAV9P517_9PEZI|nr:hypothetical protein LTR77_007297 [Saxophila tyrrhenica]